MIGDVFRVDRWFSRLTLALEPMGQPILSGVEGAKELKHQMRRVWRARLEEEVRTRISGVGRITTLYKRKAVKVVPVDEAQSAVFKVSGEKGWRDWLSNGEEERDLDRGEYLRVLISRFSTIEQRTRLTHLRIGKLNFGEYPTTNERDFLLEKLFDREAAIAFDSAEKGRFHDFIEPPPMIHTVPHMAWQAASFLVPAALHETSVHLIQDSLASGTSEQSLGPSWNTWFLVEMAGFEKVEEGKLVLDIVGKPYSCIGL